MLLNMLTYKVIAQQQPVSPKAKEALSNAVKNYRSRDFNKAQKFCRKAIETEPKWAEPYALLTSILRESGKNEEALDVCLSLMKAAPEDYTGYVNAGNICIDLKRYDSALNYYGQVANLNNVPHIFSEGSAQKVTELKFLIEQMKHPVPFNPENLGANINTKAAEYLATFTVDGETMYFTRRKIIDSMPERHMYRYNEDIMVSHKLNGQWQMAEDVTGPINTIDNEGAMAIAPDGSYMVFTGCERPDGNGSCDLYISFNRDGRWTKPVNMGAPINTRWKETQPSISFDGRSIYFSSNRPGSYGGMDIWVSTRDDSWAFSDPVNLGSEINTQKDDQTPFIHADNQTLYFCSNGHLGMGKNDLFIARKLADGTWDSVTNLGYPINTAGDEPGLVVDPGGEYAYYSNQIGGYGSLDLVRFELPKFAKPKPVTYLKGKVFDITNQKPLVADLELIDLASGFTSLKASSDKNGELLAALPGGTDYLVNVATAGYLFYSENIPLKNYKEIGPYRKDIGLHPIKAGEKVPLRNIFFASDSYILKAESKSEMKKLTDFLNTNPKVKIEIGGHTDSTGTALHNKELSTKRAKAVYDYLIKEAGISAIRLTYKGYGGAQPLKNNNTEEGKALNRRTEVKVIE